MGRLLGEEPPRSRWRAVLRWRDWSLPVKLGAVTLIPILIALVLGGVTLVDRIAHADRADRQDRLAETGVHVRSLLDALQRERTRTAEALTAGDGVD
ncbi:hypothetical protein, partial [Saccharomonospora iraqiensis]|uniref:hypothetical protein n=1 Tax=Saccharomonospora iraqiensis TaxID=52698 RepID=UPI0018EF6150